MADSLVIAGGFELLGGPGGVASVNPWCTGAIFRLSPGFDLSAPQPTTDIVTSLILSGERPYGRRASNRTITLPVLIRAPDMATLAGAREALLDAIDEPTWTLVWTRDPAGGTILPLVLDCFRAMPTSVGYGGADAYGRFPIEKLILTFQAMPYGRSDVPLALQFAAPLSGQSAPPAPVVLDNFASVSGSNWASSATQFVVGPHSAYWNPGAAPLNNPKGDDVKPTYTKTGLALDITGRTKLSVWAGLGSGYWNTWNRGPVAFNFTLTDNASNTIGFGTTRTLSASNTTAVPTWTRVTANILQGFPGFNYANITGYTITVTNTAPNELSWTWLYLDAVTANPPTVSSPASVRGAVYTLLGIQGSAEAPVSLQFQQTALTTFKTLIAHRPGFGSPAGLTPFVSAGATDPPDGREYAVTSLVAGVNARFGGTYSIVAVNNTWNNPSAQRTVTVTVHQYEYAGGPAWATSQGRIFTPSADITNGIVVIGELTLPLKDIAPDNSAAYFTVGITDTNTADRWLDILFLDTTGQTVLINSATGYVNYFLDEPDAARDLGRVLGSAADRSSAISVLDSALVSGGPLTVDVGDCQMLAYCAEGAPAIGVSYSPRWFLDRLS